MKEAELQIQIVESVKNKVFLDLITKRDDLDNLLASNNDIYFSPTFDIDGLLRRRYASSAKRVLEMLGDYELVTGNTINSISLEGQGERLYPDLVLFNATRCQLVIIENKTSSKTKREAVTELFGYTQEIRNHLPFISNFDISYVLISSEFNALLDHSVGSNLLGAEINLLCLKPVFADGNLSALEVHVPICWTAIGESALGKDAFTGYAMCLYRKEEDVCNFNPEAVVCTATDLIDYNASSFRASGFHVIWLNSFYDGEPGGECFAGISIYMLNPYVFLPEAAANNFPLNKHSFI